MPSIVDDAKATTALYLIATIMRQCSVAERSRPSVETGWDRSNFATSWEHPRHPRTGRIGLCLAGLVQTFPMRAVYHIRYCEYLGDVEMLKPADVLIVSVPMDKNTEGVVGGC